MKKIFTFTGLIFFSLAVWGQSPQMRQTDKIRIREAIQIAEQLGEKVWPKINDVPFVVLLVTDSIEFLVNHPNPSDDFKLSENDTILETAIYYRPRQFPTQLLATFPAVSGVSCIVVGNPENTGKSTSEWVITLLHEHFHQYQTHQPDYYQGVNDLNLSGGDQSGMWMLNYPFPYDSASVIKNYERYRQALYEAVKAIDQSNFEQKFKSYKTAREKLRQGLDLPDYTYLSFQIWQEGLARHTEYIFAELLKDYQVTLEFTQLQDYTPLSDYSAQLYKSEMNKLLEFQLAENKRVCFYAVGFAEGLLLDKVNPNWRKQYFKDKFFIEKYLD